MPRWRNLPHPYVIFADDLTGANDTGVQFARAGLRTRVGFRWDHTRMLGGVEIIVVDTDSRALAPADAYRTLLAAAQAFVEMRVPVLYKKIDSTLRGPIGAELDAVLDAYDLDLALVCPAFPAARRTLLQGELRVGDLPVAQTSFARDPVTPVSESHLPALLQQQTRRSVHLVTLDQVTAGVDALARHLDALRAGSGGIAVCDAVTDAHLAVIADAALALGEGALLAGAAGLARPLAERIGRRGAGEEYGRVLVVCGSMQPVVREQIATLVREDGAFVIALDAAIITGQAAWQPWIERVVRRVAGAPAQAPIVLTSPPDARLAGQEGAVLARLADLAAAVMECTRVDGVVATGGSTVRALCERWEVSGIDLVREMAPGIPLGVMSGGPFDGLPLITKAGAFGDSGTLVAAVALLTESDGEGTPR
ncbi:MAG: four-carbon acid sugar kinase family protein [Caldilinea sp.]|nr:four-carbon acid sugar kinase family protein [Caldilineaceae bacterium]MCB9119631.1 four-carbon acid sugar kinase family protein [Caldilineaceae bacterium]MCO5210933.1 four-carbon acid sugar kinase family protein [Caldilinea sp.]MCW5842568.1 four-carbon acid sugar kinase family protein [Caldilinea sp.]